jgi:hypothetical protein
MSSDVFYIDKDLTISTEHMNGDSLVVHCEIRRSTHGVIKKFYKQFAYLVEDSEGEGYKYLDAYSPNKKFCELACFVEMGLEFNYNGMVHSHYRYYLGGD